MHKIAHQIRWMADAQDQSSLDHHMLDQITHLVALACVDNVEEVEQQVKHELLAVSKSAAAIVQRCANNEQDYDKSNDFHALYSFPCAETLALMMILL